MTTIKARAFISSFLVVAVLASVNPYQPIALAAQPEADTSAKFSTDMVAFELSGTYSLNGTQPSGTGEFPNNNTGGNLGPYPEGSCLPASINVTNKEKDPADLNFEVVFDYKHQGNPTDVVGIEALEHITANVAGNPRNPSVNDLNLFSYTNNDLTSANQFPSSNGTVSASISGPYSGPNGSNGTSDNDTTRHYNVSLTSVPGNTDVYMLFCAQLGVDAADFPGASLSIKPQGGAGGGNMSITVSTILHLPSLSITKDVVGGTAKPSDFSFYVNPMIKGSSTYTIAAGSSTVVIDNIQVDGQYTIQENGSAADYKFTSGSGTNCTFDGGTATVQLAASENPINATCVFTNTYSPVFVATTGTVTVVQKIINDNGGTATLNDFTSTLNYNSTILPITGSATSTFTVPAPVSYWVSYPMNIPNYSVTYLGDCSQNLAVGQNLTCTVIYNDDPIVIPPGATTSTLTVIKNVVGSDKSAREFNLLITSTSTDLIAQQFRGNAGGTLFVLQQGEYSVTENPVENYTTSYTDGCNGTITAGIPKVCTVTNTYVPPAATTGTVTIIKQVVNDYKGTAVASDFSFTLYSSSTEPISVQGNASGTTVTIPVGNYYVEEGSHEGYNATYSSGCSGNMAGASMICTVTNDDIGSGGNGGFEQTTSTLTVIKRVVNGDGGTAKASDFHLSINTSSTSPITFDGNASGTTQVINKGAYYVSEEAAVGYAASYSTSCSGIAAAGETIECIVTNTYTGQTTPSTTGTLIVIKRLSHDYLRPGDFRLTATFTSLPQEENEDTAYRTAMVAPSTTVAFSGDANGTRLTVNPGRYSVSEQIYPNWRADYSETCSGTIAAGQTITCVVTNNYTTGGGSSGGGNGGSGAGWTPGIFTPSTPTTPTTPTPRVLGVEDTEPSLCVITENEALYVNADVQAMLNHLGKSRDLAMEEYYNRVLVPKVVPKDLAPSLLSAVQNFVNYGTKSNQRLGHGERAGALNSFRAFHGHVPANECEWQEVIRIANTKLPSELDQAREQEILKTTFPEIYQREARNSALDTIAKQMMAYGIRPQIRDLKAETEALKVYKKIYRKLPSTASEWDANRALAYSGLEQKMLATDLTKSPSRVLEILVPSTSLALK